MMVSGLPKEQWMIRDLSGKVLGPYTKEAIGHLILRGVITGEESISKYPHGTWAALASIPEFYDLIIDSLEADASNPIDSSSADKMEANTVLVTRHQTTKQRDVNNNTGSLTGEATKVAEGSHFGEFTKTILTGLSNLTKSLPSFGTKPTSAPTTKKPFDRSRFIPVNNSIPTITTNQSSASVRFSWPSINFRLIALLFLGFLVVGALIYIVLNEFNSGANINTDGKIHLLAPGAQNGYLTPEESKAYLMKVKAAFEHDNTSNWIEAQNILVKMAEAAPSNTEVRELLCLSYKELWQYAFQDAEDLQVLNHMAQTTKALNPSSRHGRTCELVRSWLTGKFQEAKGQLELLIQEYPSISFYIWLKTDMLISENDYINGQGFASSLIAIWPEFTRGKILSAQASIGVGRFQEAREMLVRILEQNPVHKVAMLMLGDMEFRNFQQEEKAWELLIRGIKSPEAVPRSIQVTAYTTLALLSERRGDMKAAKKFAEQGFQLNPTSETLRALVKKFGGSDKNFNQLAQTQEMVALGDQYVRSGDCLAAQAQYRAAFDLNPKFPVAAVKAARCLYKINQIFQAFEYLKKAIKYNPEYFPAYTLLADYYSQKFDFASAMGVLNQARAYSTEAYELYKGYALVELRKNNFSGSLGFINRAIGIYSTDPEAYVIMAKAQLIGGHPKEAVQAAQKAIEIDPINIEGQITYGQALGVLQGESTGVQYLKKLVTENKYVLEYKLALADALRDLGRHNESLPIYEETVALDPKNKRAQLGLGDSLSGVGRVEAALSAYLLAATFDPTDPEPIMRAGLLYLDTSRLDPAIQQFERALIINKNYPKAYYYIGKAAFMKGDLQRALDSALAERRANPNIVESYLLAAEVYTVTRKYAQCTTEYQQAIKIRSQGAANYVKLARCYRLSGSYDVAQSMLDIAAEKESGYAEIYKERGALYQVQGEKEAAYKAYEKYLALSPNAVDKSEIEALMSQLAVR